MNANTAKNLDKLQGMIDQTIDQLITQAQGSRAELLKEARLFVRIGREAIEAGDMDRAGRAFERALARVKEVAA